MLRATSVVSICTFLLVGCAGSQLGLENNRRPELAYTAPTNPPAKPIAFNLNGSVEQVVGRLMKALDGPRFGITHVNDETGVITAVYRADPEDFIDLWFVRSDAERW